MEIQPKLTQNRLNLAACLIEVKQLARAEAQLEEIVRDYPRFPGAQFNLGVLYEEQGRPQEARTAYAAEVSNYPDHFKARFNLGKVLSRMGDDGRRSIEQMREVVRIAPKRPEGYLFLARGLLHESAPAGRGPGPRREGAGPRPGPRRQGARLVPAGRRLQPQAPAGQGGRGAPERADAGLGRERGISSCDTRGIERVARAG